MTDLLERYKDWVRKHPGIIQNLDWLLCLVVWNPARLSSSEFGYESYHAAVGLLSVWHNHILEEGVSYVKKPVYSLWLDMLEQVETIIELRAMHLEKQGSMSRYSPLAVLETTKAILKMLMWSQYAGHLFLRNPGPEDIEQFESEQGLQDLMAALQRLRTRYTSLADCSLAASHDMRAAASSWVTWGSSLLPHSLASWLNTSGGSASSAATAPTTSGLSCQAAGPAYAADGGAHEDFATSCPLSPPPVPWAPLHADLVADADQHRVKSHGEASTSSSHLPPSPRSFHSLRQGSLLQGASISSSDAAAQAACLAEQHMGMNLMWLGELLHIWRPVVYVALLRRYGRTSWRPWWTSLAVDMLSTYFQQRGKFLMRHAASMQPHHMHPGSLSYPSSAALLQSPRPLSPFRYAPSLPAAPGTSLLSLALLRSLNSQQWSPGEERELYDRRRKLALYLLRSPCFDTVLQPLLEAVRRGTARVPLLGMLTDYMVGLLGTFTEYYTYTSGSS